MMKIAQALFSIVALGASVALAQQAPAQYFRPMASGSSDFKIAAIQELVTYDMMAGASYASSDTRIQEMVGLARALDVLLYDGLRLVRYRGALVTRGAIDENAIARAMYYFNVNAGEAKAWMVASRLMQMADFKDDGAALAALEYDLLQTAGDLYLRLATYVGSDAALSCMPRVAAHWSAANAPAPQQQRPEMMGRVFYPAPAQSVAMPVQDKQERMMIIRMPR